MTDDKYGFQMVINTSNLIIDIKNIAKAYIYMLYFRTVNSKLLDIYRKVGLALWTLWILIYNELKKSYLNYTRIPQKHITIS